MDTKLHFSTGKDNYETPDDFFKALDDRYHFVLDAAADARNHKCVDYLGPGGIVEDALECSWSPWLTRGNIWLNPPYSRKLQAKFVEKAWEEATLHHMNEGTNSVVCLLPARTDTKLFHQTIQQFGKIEFICRRLKFKGAAHGAPFPSMVVIF